MLDCLVESRMDCPELLPVSFLSCNTAKLCALKKKLPANDLGYLFAYDVACDQYSIAWICCPNFMLARCLFSINHVVEMNHLSLLSHGKDVPPQAERQRPQPSCQVQVVPVMVQMIGQPGGPSPQRTNAGPKLSKK